MTGNKNNLWERWNRTAPDDSPINIHGLARYLSMTVDQLADRVERYPRKWSKLRDCWEYVPSEVMEVVLRESDEIKRRLAENPAADLRVYAIQCVENGLIKLGVSNDPKRRLVALSCQSPVEMVLLASRPGGYQMEKELHKRFAEHRRRGEWFAPHADILAWVAECPTD